MNEYSEQYTDEELIKGYRDGQVLFGEHLINRYRPLVKKKARLYYLEGGDHEDLIQEGMVGLFKAMQEYEPERKASFFTFAQLCINHQMLSAIETASRQKHRPLNESLSIDTMDENQVMNFFGCGDDPETIVVEHESTLQLLEDFKKSLSTMEKQVLDMYLDGFDYLQIAERLGKSGKSIDNCLQRIKSKIRNNSEIR